MKHIIISDTHSPQCIRNAYMMLRELLPKKPDIDAIVINGDLLGIFSMASSSLHKGTRIPPEQMMAYLKAAAPRFFRIFSQTRRVTPELALQYVAERYLWAANTLAKFANLRLTLFNMGNHESPLHFLVLRELPFLTGCDCSIIERVDRKKLMEIFDAFEQKLRDMESQMEFKYLRDSPIIMDNVLIMGIPGESHDTTEDDPPSKAQEEKTQRMIDRVKPALPRVSSIIIYNHTQGNYNRTTGEFDCASKSLSAFMKDIPENVKVRIFVQSHNHWNHTQFFIKDGFHFIMNNAGLHAGIFNAISVKGEAVKCFDMDPNERQIIPLKLFTADNNLIVDDEDVISRNYPDPGFILKRRDLRQAI